jgi:hypothetical protein
MFICFNNKLVQRLTLLKYGIEKFFLKIVVTRIFYNDFKLHIQLNLTQIKE